MPTLECLNLSLRRERSSHCTPTPVSGQRSSRQPPCPVDTRQITLISMKTAAVQRMPVDAGVLGVQSRELRQVLVHPSAVEMKLWAVPSASAPIRKWVSPKIGFVCQWPAGRISPKQVPMVDVIFGEGLDAFSSSQPDKSWPGRESGVGADPRPRSIATRYGPLGSGIVRLRRKALVAREHPRRFRSRVRRSA